MAKLTMFKGLPASGKSFLSREMLSQNKSLVRLNRDDLRAMMYGKDGSWSGKKESLVVAAEKAMAISALNSNFDVIIDDTNLNPKNEAMWKGLAASWNAQFKIRKMDVDIELCISRDRFRPAGSRVGRAVIENMALSYDLLPNLPASKGKITIWDVDGTLMNIDHRLGRVDKDGRKIHVSALKHEAHMDYVNQTIADWFNSADSTTSTFIVSGRGTDEAILTEDMLDASGVIPDRMFMRNSGDHRSDTIVKQEILDKIIQRYGRNAIEFIVDDRPTVVAMWRSNGLKVYPVNQQSWDEGQESSH